MAFTSARSMRLTRVLVGTTTAACVGVYAAPRLLQSNPELFGSNPQQARRLALRIEDGTVLTERGFYDQRKWWTLVTYSFAHANTLHLVLNMVSLQSVGLLSGAIFGPGALVSLWIGGAATGGYLGMRASASERRSSGSGGVLDEYGRGGNFLDAYRAKTMQQREISHVGASGSICAMLSAIACANPKMKFHFIFPPIGLPAWLFVFIFAGGSIWAQSSDMKSFGANQISHMGHIGGLGFGVCYFLARRLLLRR